MRGSLFPPGILRGVLLEGVLVFSSFAVFIEDLLGQVVGGSNLVTSGAYLRSNSDIFNSQ